MEVFVSFTGADVAWAEWIAAVLGDAGYTVRFQRWDFGVGSNFVTEMSAALEGAKRLVMVTSSRYWDSVMATAEWTAAFALEKPLIPIRIEDVDPPALLASIVSVDVFGVAEVEARARIVEALRGPGRPPGPVRFPGGLARWPSVPVVFEAPPRPLPLAGRDEVLAELRERLAGAQAVTLTQALAGPGGIGKTVLAAEYAWRYRSDYQLVWWVPSEQRPLILDSYTRLASRLAVTVPEDLEALPGLVHQALDRLAARWLLVFDNALDFGAVAPFLPSGDGHVLITSRNPAWGGRQATIDVTCLDQATAAQYLLARASGGNGEPPEAERAAAKVLAEELGGLPLALAQAGAYIDAYGESLVGYLGLFQDQRAALLVDAPSPLDYRGTVHTAVNLALDRLSAEPAALALLELLAFLGPGAIPLELLLGTDAVELPAEMAALAGADRGHERNLLGIGPLRAVSLIERDAARIKVHRLTQAVIRDQLEPDRRADRLGLAVELVTHALDLDPDDPGTWATFAALLPAARATADHTRTYDVHRLGGLSLLHRLSVYLFRRGDLTGARALFEEVLLGRRKVLGARHPDTLRSINNLAILFAEQGELAGAHALFEEALAAHREILGDRHPQTLASINNLAITLREQGDLGGARALDEEALAARRKMLGDRHPDTLTSINNLGETLRRQGDSAGARALHEQALAARREALGDRHPDTLRSIGNLASTLREQGDLAGARALGEEALAGFRELGGACHPDTLRSIHNLGETLRAQGAMASARALHEQALAARREVLGDRHPDTLRSINNLAFTLWAQGDLAGARTLHEEALTGRREVLGPHHPDTVQSAWNLYRTLGGLDPTAAVTVLHRDLRWLLDQEPDQLTADQAIIRIQVAEEVRKLDPRQ